MCQYQRLNSSVKSSLISIRLHMKFDRNESNAHDIEVLH
jgi:hypothetical protein